MGLSKQGQDAMFSALAVPCILSFPPKRVQCSNCTLNPITGRSNNIYVSGGQAPFDVGICPMCQGNGYMEQVVTSNIKMQLNWNTKTFLAQYREITVKQSPDTFCQTKCLLSDIPQILQATECLFNSPLSPTVRWRFRRQSEVIPDGIVQLYYGFLLWIRIGN